MRTGELCLPARERIIRGYTGEGRERGREGGELEMGTLARAEPHGASPRNRSLARYPLFLARVPASTHLLYQPREG